MYAQTVLYRVKMLRAHYSGTLCEFQLNDFDIEKLKQIECQVEPRQCARFPYFIRFPNTNATT